MIELSDTATNILLIVSWILLWYGGFTTGRKFWICSGAKELLDRIEYLGSIQYVKEENEEKILVNITSESRKLM